jgi:hypothetical protein
MVGCPQRRALTIVACAIALTGHGFSGHAGHAENTGHMRRALYRLEGANHFTTSWEFFRVAGRR